MCDAKQRLKNVEDAQSALQERIAKLEIEVAYLKGVVTTLIALVITLVGVALRVLFIGPYANRVKQFSSLGFPKW